MKRLYLYTLYVAIFIIITFSFSAFANDTNRNNIDFLASYGWSVSAMPTERVNVILPVVEDDVFRAYNRLQREVGFDLTSYYGKHLTRYTYLVLNYPKETNEPVFANLLVFEGKVIAGDIMTVSSDGFMHSLLFPVN